jgi:hypothetical protein
MGTFTKNADGTWSGPRDKVCENSSRRERWQRSLRALVMVALSSAESTAVALNLTATALLRKYDTKGQLSEMWGSKGDYSSFKYDEQGNRTEMTLWQKDQATGKYAEQPQTFKAETPGGPLH